MAAPVMLKWKCRPQDGESAESDSRSRMRQDRLAWATRGRIGGEQGSDWVCHWA